MHKKLIIVLIFTQIHTNFGIKECIVEDNPNQQKCDGGDIIERNICIPNSYDKIYPPVEPVILGANFKELDIINIDIKNQVIRLAIDYAISWQDGRIKFIGNKTATEKMLEKDQTSKFWLPKLQVNKLMDADSYRIIGSTTILYVFPGCIERNTSPYTLVTYASKDVISFACTMDFTNFPFDGQKCKLKVICIRK